MVMRAVLPYAPSGGLVLIDLKLILITLVGIICIGLLSGIYPAWRAGRITAPGGDQRGGCEMNENLIAMEARNLTKVYVRGAEEITAVNNVSLGIDKGEFVSIIGPSGSGKTTLVNLLGCLDNPTSGELYLGGRSIFGAGKRLSERDLTKDQEGDLRLYLSEFLSHPHPDRDGKRDAAAYLLPQARHGA